ncbi:hypothetical protein [Humisphaera borealis]|uniref:Uncharacterized protein n=1 Tax=Humisphaera borealis TaxID=2807512 RepID=A0A7M2X372_9BACT|nr:hypothetical protein [Humisphaera borealis]QOV92125.1 hypothetical protein IPV69_12525 [Humisphaera borealis]
MSPIPSLKGRRRNPPAAEILLAIPRISPERELAVIQALIKPQTGRALRHQLAAGEQAWPRDAATRVAQVATAAEVHFGLQLAIHVVPDGEYLAIARVGSGELPAALATAVLLSKVFPGTWIVVGRLFVRDGRFFRRERGVKLNLRPASNVHLTQPLRAALNRAIAGMNDRGEA